MGLKEKVDKLVRLGDQVIQAYIDGISDEEKAIVGKSDDWSPKDVVAHMTMWKEQIVLSYQASKRGETEPVRADYQALNAETFEKHKDLSWQEVLDYSEKTHQTLFAELETITEEDLARTEGIPMQGGRPFWRMVVGIAYTHPMGHLRDPVLARGEFERAVEMQEESCQLLSELDDDDSWMGAQQYNLACTYSLVGQKEKAISILRKALKMTPELTDWSKEDPDFEPIREHPDYKAIYTD